jgi:sulfate adenylyltransferase subunit 2
LVGYATEQGRAEELNPIDHGHHYTTMMRTEALKQALDRGGYDVIFGGARRDEEKSRAKERIFSIRAAQHGWEPRQQRPELGNCYYGKLQKGLSVRVFPLSNSTELDLWTYIHVRKIELAPLYYAKERRVVRKDGALIALDEPDRLPRLSKDLAETLRVRFRTLGCWPVTGAVESEVADTREIIRETLLAPTSERRGRVSDEGSLEQQKRQGYYRYWVYNSVQ